MGLGKKKKKTISTAAFCQKVKVAGFGGCGDTCISIKYTIA